MWWVMGALTFGSAVGYAWGYAHAEEKYRPRMRVVPGERETDRAQREQADLWEIASRQLGLDHEGRLSRGHPVPPPDTWLGL